MSENIKRKKDFVQVCVWTACVVGVDKVDEFVELMSNHFGVRVQYLEEIKTGPDTVDGTIVPETGNRNDLFFAVHKDDINKFAIKRMEVGIRWIEDVLSINNYRCAIYPERVHDYKSW